MNWVILRRDTSHRSGGLFWGLQWALGKQKSLGREEKKAVSSEEKPSESFMMTQVWEEDAEQVVFALRIFT